MSDLLTVGEIQNRLFEYAGFKKDLKIKHNQQKITVLHVVAEEAKTKIKVSIQEVCANRNTFPVGGDDQLNEFETYSLDEVFVGTPRIDAISIEAQGVAPIILNGMQNLLDHNPHATIYMSFNSSRIQNAGFNPKSFAYNLLTMGFSISKIDEYGQICAVSEEELLKGTPVNLTLKRVIQREFYMTTKKEEENPIYMEVKPIDIEKPMAVVTKPKSDFNYYHPEIPNPQKQGGVIHNLDSQEKVFQGLVDLGIDVENYEVDVQEYRQFFQNARYVQDFPDYYSFNLPEKTLEHYIAAKLLQLNDKDIYIDIASQHSPTPEIYHRLFGVKAYLQDLDYPHGLNGNKIGGDAANMPVPDEFATKMALHCSFEHFENGSDQGFIQEVSRILKPGGAVCITPFYLFDEYAIQTDPAVSIPQGVKFDDDATVYCAYGWGNRHGRFYDPDRVFSRVCQNLNGMKIKIYSITNAKQVDPSCYVQFAALITKLSADEPLNNVERYAHALTASGIIT